MQGSQQPQQRRTINKLAEPYMGYRVPCGSLAYISSGAKQDKQGNERTMHVCTADRGRVQRGCIEGVISGR